MADKSPKVFWETTKSIVIALPACHEHSQSSIEWCQSPTLKPWMKHKSSVRRMLAGFSSRQPTLSRTLSGNLYMTKHHTSWDAALTVGPHANAKYSWRLDYLDYVVFDDASYPTKVNTSHIELFWNLISSSVLTDSQFCPGH